MNIPMIDKTGRVVGWTATGPTVFLGKIHHSESARLFAGGFTSKYVELVDPVDAAQAGAPVGWRQPWRCIALCEIGSGSRA